MLPAGPAPMINTFVLILLLPKLIFGDEQKMSSTWFYPIIRDQKIIDLNHYVAVK